MNSARKSFDATGSQWAWDSTSLKAAEKCPRYYQYSILEGWKSPYNSVHLWFGGIYASALETYHKLRAEGVDYESAVAEVFYQALVESWDHERDESGQRIPSTGQPAAFDHASKNRETLLRTIVWYLDEFRDDHFRTFITAEGKAAVEHSFQIPVDEGITLCGHIDRLCVDPRDEVFVHDQKAQPLTTKVLTLDGWKAIGDLHIGDEIIGQDGNPTTVIGLYPKGITPVYKVSFVDGTSVLCGEDHLWTVGSPRLTDLKTLTVHEILDTMYIKYYVPKVRPVQHPERNLPVDPYVLGVLLGDGYLGGNSVALSTSKEWLAEKVRIRLPDTEVLRKSPSANLVWTITGGKTLNGLRQLGLWKKLSADKFVPDVYLFASEQQRRDLLAGLLDTDGTWDCGRRRYDSTSIHLVKAVCSLVRSLGGLASYYDRKDSAYRVSFWLPELDKGRSTRYIENIDRVEDAETMCIKVAAANGLYVTEDYIVTHNTTGSTIGPYFFKGFKPDIQFALYSFAGRVVYSAPVKGVIVDGAQIAVGFTRFGRAPILYTEAELNESYDEMMDLIKTTRQMTQDRFFPRRTASCGNYGGCQFREVCSRPPQVRENFLKADFVKDPHWDPIVARD